MAAPASAQTTTSSVVEECMAKALADEEGHYMSHFYIRLPAATAESDPPVVREVRRLAPNWTYRFTLCNADATESGGVLVLDIYDGDRRILSSYDRDSERHFSSVDFACSRMGNYTFLFYFLNGEPGEASAVITQFRTRAR